MSDETGEPPAAKRKRELQPKDDRVIGLEEAGENAGVEDTPYNAPEEMAARERLRGRSPKPREDRPGRSDG
jgi:hypothetical protein